MYDPPAHSAPCVLVRVLLQVVITAPGKGAIPTYVMGVNADQMTGDEPIISNASCTTNGMACFVKVRAPVPKSYELARLALSALFACKSS